MSKKVGNTDAGDVIKWGVIIVGCWWLYNKFTGGGSGFGTGTGNGAGNTNATGLPGSATQPYNPNASPGTSTNTTGGSGSNTGAASPVTANTNNGTGTRKGSVLVMPPDAQPGQQIVYSLVGTQLYDSNGNLYYTFDTPNLGMSVVSFDGQTYTVTYEDATGNMENYTVAASQVQNIS